MNLQDIIDYLFINENDIEEYRRRILVEVGTDDKYKCAYRKLIYKTTILKGEYYDLRTQLLPHGKGGRNL